MSKVTPLPGVKPRKFVNESAANQLQGMVNKIRDGELAGFAIVAIKTNGDTSSHWNVPSGMGKFAYIGTSSMFYRMLKEIADV